MATMADLVRHGSPWTAGQRAALEVLSSDVVGHRLAEAITAALVGSMQGRPANGDLVQDLDPTDIEMVREFAADHRVRSAVNRVVPGAGGDPVEALTGAIVMERHLLEVLDTFAPSGIALAVLKGNATARLDHRHWSDREAGDIDVLVPAARFDEAAAMLTGAGFVRSITHPFATSSFFHSETFRHRDGWELDLHQRLAQASRPPHSCWVALDHFELGGRLVPALPAPWRFLHALVHQIMNPPPSFRGVNGLLDLVSMWEHDVDLDAVRRAADEVGLRAVTERGLVRMGQLLERDVPAPAQTPREGRLERRVARAFDGVEPVPGHLSFLAGVSAQPWAARPRYVRELLWPTAAYREMLGVSPWQQARHVVSEALGRRPT